MKVFVLIFSIGLSSGHNDLIGIYSSLNKADESKKKHMIKNAYGEHHYSIQEIEINKDLNITYDEW